jgi:hypothetical protein
MELHKRKVESWHFDLWAQTWVASRLNVNISCKSKRKMYISCLLFHMKTMSHIASYQWDLASVNKITLSSGSLD